MKELSIVVACFFIFVAGYLSGKRVADRWYHQYSGTGTVTSDWPVGSVTGGGSGISFPINSITTSMPLTVTTAPVLVKQEKACILTYSDGTRDFEPCDKNIKGVH